MDNNSNKNENPLIQYAKYSSIVFQMLAIIGLSFWGGNELEEYLGYDNHLITVLIGFLGMALALYVTIKNLEKIK